MRYSNFGEIISSSSSSKKTGLESSGNPFSFWNRIHLIILRDVRFAKALLKIAISKLNKREMEIMKLRFGIEGNGKEKTQKEVADMMGISQSYISRLEKRIMKKMKKEIMSKTG